MEGDVLSPACRHDAGHAAVNDDFQIPKNWLSDNSFYPVGEPGNDPTDGVIMPMPTNASRLLMAARE
jgi:hypothetical protein